VVIAPEPEDEEYTQEDVRRTWGRTEEEKPRSVPFTYMSRLLVTEAERPRHDAEDEATDRVDVRMFRKWWCKNWMPKACLNPCPRESISFIPSPALYLPSLPPHIVLAYDPAESTKWVLSSDVITACWRLWFCRTYVVGSTLPSVVWRLEHLWDEKSAAVLEAQTFLSLGIVQGW